MTKEELINAANEPVTDEQLEDYRLWRVEMEKQFEATRRMHDSPSNWQATEQ